MSRDMLDKTLAGDKSRLEEHYEPGKSYDGLISELLSHYEMHYQSAVRTVIQDTELREQANQEYWDRMASILEEYLNEEFNPQAFLDSLIFNTSKQINGHVLIQSGTQFIDPLVQLLYPNYDSLDLNCSILLQKGLGIARSLEGSPKKKLSARYIGNFTSFGSDARYCSLTLQGKCVWAAMDAKHSDFVFLDKVGTIGHHSKECTYYVMGPLTEETQFCGKNNAYYVHEDIKIEMLPQLLIGQGLATNDENIMKLICWDYFSKRNNTLFVPDPDNPGEWNEIQPFPSREDL